MSDAANSAKVSMGFVLCGAVKEDTRLPEYAAKRIGLELDSYIT
jgi:hypothetical protein